MLLDIPENTELVCATLTGVKTYKRGDDLDSEAITNGSVKVLGMRLIKPATITSRALQSQSPQIQYGSLMLNIGIGILLYQHFGAWALCAFGFAWMIIAAIAQNTKREVNSLQRSAQSSTSTPGAPSAQDRSTG